MIDCCCETDYLLTLVDYNTHSVLISNENYYQSQTNQILDDEICDNVLGNNIVTCSYNSNEEFNIELSLRPSSSETGSSSMHELFSLINDVSVNMQPPAVVNVCTDIDSIPSNLTNDTCVSYATFSGSDISASGQTPAEQQGSYSDSSLSQGGDYTSVYSSLGTDDASITINGMSDDTGSSQSSSNYLLDLGLKCKGFRMGHINIQGISNKIDQVRMLLESDKNQIHVLGLSETKLNDIHPDSAFQVNGFQKPFRRDREANSGGGILVYVRDGISCSRRSDLEHKNLECIWLEIKPVKSKPFLLCNIYRPPNSTVQWNSIFEDCMENVLKEEKELYLMGDFNRDLLNVQIKNGLTIWNHLV